MTSRWMLLAAAVAGASGVLLGAFAAHGLQSRLPPSALDVFRTGVDYQLVHALALGLTGIAARSVEDRALAIAGTAFAVGVVLFSFSLYALALGAPRGLGLVTPVGGIAFITGWVALGVGGFRHARSD